MSTIEFYCYNNIPKLIEYRKQTRITDIIGDNIIMIEDKLSSTAFEKILTENQYINFAGRIGNMLNLYVLIAEKSTLASSSAVFKDVRKAIISDIIDFIETQTGISKLKITYIVSKAFSIHFAKSSDAEVEGIDHEWEAHVYDKFIQPIPEHELVPKHEFCPQDEIDKYCKFHNIEVNNLPKIQLDDPMAVWLGAKIGDVIKIHRLSENCAVSYAYRYVVDDRKKIKQTKRKKKKIITSD